jgi:hypothetical protein
MQEDHKARQRELDAKAEERAHVMMSMYYRQAESTQAFLQFMAQKVGGADPSTVIAELLPVATFTPIQPPSLGDTQGRGRARGRGRGRGRGRLATKSTQSGTQ